MYVGLSQTGLDETGLLLMWPYVDVENAVTHVASDKSALATCAFAYWRYNGAI